MTHSRGSVVGFNIPRTRTMGAIQALDLYYHGGPSGQPFSYSGSALVSALSGTHKVISDLVTKGYRSVRSSGHVPNKPCTITSVVSNPFLAGEFTRTFSSGATETMSGPVVSWIFGRCDSLAPSFTDAEKDAANRAATIKAWSEVAPAKSQSLVTGAEAHKTWELLGGTAEKIYRNSSKLVAIVIACRRHDVKALRKLLPGTKRTKVSNFVLWDDDGRPLLDKRGNIRRSRKRVIVKTNNRKYLDEASQLWLEYRYGWSPLVYDMIDSLKAVYEADLRRSLTPRDLEVARGKTKIAKRTSEPLLKVAGGLTYSGRSDGEALYEVRTYVHYRWKAPDGVLRRLNDFGLFDFPRALWEIVPFSFVVDWFSPIGDWLGALTPKLGVEVVDQGHVKVTQVSNTVTLTGFPIPNVGGIVFAPAAPIGSKDFWSQQEYIRATDLGIPFYPPIDVKLNVKRMADAATLLKGMR